MANHANRPSRRSVSALASRMRTAGGIKAAAEILREVAGALGLSNVAVLFDASHPTILRDESGQNLTDTFGWPPGFIEKWLERNLTGHSPSIMRARFELVPFSWTVDEPMPDVDVDADAHKAVEAMVSVGITGGILAPVRMPRGRLGAVGWLGHADGPTLARLLARNGPALLAVAHYFFEHLRPQFELATVAEDLARLTPREVECLRAAASGYSDVEVAKLTGLSSHTVRFHHRNAAEKLGARSRTAAVALAMQLGLLGPIPLSR